LAASPYERLDSDFHMDAASQAFLLAFTSGEMSSPTWCVTSPPYGKIMPILKVALEICTVGVALKIPLNFLEPRKTGAAWLAANPPARVITLDRAIYRGKWYPKPEAWMIWMKK
jgi:hypothetical protein